MNTSKPDIYERITTQIIEAIERGAESREMPWHKLDAETMAPHNAKTKTRYNGINVLALWIQAERMGYTSGLWATYKQWTELGAQVKRGEKATHVVFWKVEEKDTEEPQEGEERGMAKRFFARSYSVFNLAQVEGYEPETIPVLPQEARIKNAEAFFFSLGAEIRHGGNEAYYSSQSDYIQMPSFGVFKDAIGYYSILAHELIHWSGHRNRLDRVIDNRFGTQPYAAEELIAELGAAFVLSRLGLSAEPREDHAAYISRWLELLANDKKAIFAAASKAQQAADYLFDQAKKLEAAA